ncbi:hypothetical protein GCM10027589_21250 [Actinocorallia lasiicapitis]
MNTNPYGRQHPSPAGWAPPPGTRPGWNWLPPGGATPRPDRMPTWLRLCYATPFLDRCAHTWMWHRGGWDVHPAPTSQPP